MSSVRPVKCRAASMRQVPGPDRGEWARWKRERARLDAEELLPRPPFGVSGLVAPRLRPVALAEAGRVDGVLETVTLAYGDEADPGGPFVTVASAAARPGAAGLGTEADLVRVIGRERNRLADYAGIDEEEPPGAPEYWGKTPCRRGERQRADLPARERGVHCGSARCASRRPSSASMSVRPIRCICPGPEPITRRDAACRPTRRRIAESALPPSPTS